MEKTYNKKIFHPKCELCKKRIADRKNSHILPSFIICKTASADGSGKRNHELVYSIGNTIQVYSGNEVPMEVIEENFNDLSEERIEDLKINNMSKDYIFCSSCEKALANYLEAPYSAGKVRDPITAYYFWISVIWRVNHFKLFEKRMPKFISTELRKSLDIYLFAKKKGVQVNKIPQNFPFNYRILQCNNYSKDGEGVIYAEYDKSNRIFSISLGDLIICFNFKSNDLPDDYTFLGLENEFKQAPLNCGLEPEKARNVPIDVFFKAYMLVMYKAGVLYYESESNKIYHLWKKIHETYGIMPEPIPSNLFIQKCINSIHDDRIKLGEKNTKHTLAMAFSKAMLEVYGIQIPN